MNLKKLIGILSEPSLAKLLVGQRIAAGVEHIPILKSLSAETVVDVGANKGQFAAVCRLIYPRAAIFSFEPLPGPISAFRRAFAGDSRVSVFQAAVGPEKIFSLMNVSAREDSSSLLPISGLQSKLFPGTQCAGQVEVQIDRLDAYLAVSDVKRPALLKIDVQGYELEVLRGCETLIGAFDAVYVECSFVELYEGQALANEVVAWLQARSFKLMGVHNPAYDDQGRAVQADFFFSRS